GIYLWHYPIIVLTVAVGAASGPVSPVRAVVLVAATVAAAAVSWRFIESPIRSGARLRWVKPERAQGEAGSARRWRPAPPRSPQAIGALCVLSVALVAAGVTASMRLTSATGHPAPDANSPAMANAQLSNSG